MEQTVYSGTVKNGTIGGTLLVLLANVSSSELIKTMLVAAVGAAVSFIVSFLPKLLTDVIRSRGHKSGSE